VLDAVLLNGVQVARDQLNDVSKPVLADGGDHIYGDLILNVLAVPVVRDAASIDSGRVCVAGVHASVVLFRFICGLNIAVSHDIKLSSSLVDVFVAHNASLNVDVEAFTTGSEVGSNLMRNRKVVTLGRDWGSKSAAEGIDDRGEAAHGFVRATEALGHEGFRIVGEERELLLGGHRVVTGSKELASDAGLIEGLLELAGGRVIDIVGVVRNMAAGGLETHCLDLSGTLTSVVAHGGVDVVHVTFHSLAFCGVGGHGGKFVGALSLGSVVNNVFNGLLALALRLHLAERRVHHLAVDSLELSVLKEIDLDVGVFGEELSNKLEEVQ